MFCGFSVFAFVYKSLYLCEICSRRDVGQSTRFIYCFYSFNRVTMEKAPLKLKLKLGTTPEPPTMEVDSIEAVALTADDEQSCGPADHVTAATGLETANEVGREKQHKKSKKKKKKKEREKDRHKHKRDRPQQEPEADDESISKRQRTDEAAAGEASSAPPPTPAAVAAALRDLLFYLLKQLEKRDTNMFFVEPVTDLIAPAYSSIITQPMCFVTMRDKVSRGLYTTLNQFEADVKLIVANCLKYNGPDTVYYSAGKKLLSAAQVLFSREKLMALRKELPSIAILGHDTFGFTLCDGSGEGGDSGGDDRTDSPNSQDSRSEGDEEDGEEEEEEEDSDEEEEAARIIEQARGAARAAARTLHNRKPTSTMGYLKTRPDGSVGLTFLSGVSGAAAAGDTVPLNMGLVLGKLTAGSATLHNYHDDKRTMAKPVKPIHYGSYSSFCPSYDSTFANLSKEESDLVRATYGNETAVQYAESICEFSRDCSMATSLVDQLLNLLTSGQHSRTHTTIAQQHQLQHIQRMEQQDDKKDVKPPADAAPDIPNLRSLSSIGIDTAFLDYFEQIQQQKEAAGAQLNNAAELVQSLATEQNDRLSKQSSQSPLMPTQPSHTEIHLAERLTSELVSVARLLPPSALLPAPAATTA